MNPSRLLTEFYAINVDKGVISESDEKNAPVTFKALLQRSDALNQNGRVYPKDILNREVENYRKAIEEGRAVGECVPAGTDILTESGWKDIEKVVAGEQVYTLNLDNSEVELQKVSEKVYKKYTDDIVKIKSSKLDMEMTKGHKVVLWDRNDKPYSITAMELHDGLKNKDPKLAKSYVKRGGDWQGESPESISIGSVTLNSEKWAAFLGIYLAEGFCDGTKRGYKRSNKVSICQKKEAEKSKIRELMNSLGVEWKEYTYPDGKAYFVMCNEDLHSHLFVLGDSHNKYIPDYAKKWDKKLLGTMFDWMLMGDGKNRKNRKGILIKEYCTTSTRLANDVQEILIKLGNGANISKYHPKDRFIEGRKILAENSKPILTVHEHVKSRGPYMDHRFVKASLEEFDDYVYCVRVPNQTWFMKKNDKLCVTHNCDHPDTSVVSLKNASHIIEDIWWEGNEVWGKVRLLSTDEGKRIRTLIGDGVKIGISSRGVGETIKNNEGHEVVDESYMLVAFDLVSEPSTHEAWLMKEGRQLSLEAIRKLIPKTDRVNRIIDQILGE